MSVLLIADDNADLLVVLDLLFRRAGFTVLTAADGDSALRLAQVERPDIVLTDLDMPGMNGIELCRAIRADPVLGDIPVAILSGGAKAGDPRPPGAQACTVLSKPFTNDDLVASVRALADAGRHSHDTPECSA